MRVWGVSCHIESGEPVVTAVELDPGGKPKLVLLHRTNPSDDWSQKLRLLASDFDTQLRRAPPQALIVKSMDWSKFRHEGPTKLRYQVEGVLLATARDRVDLVESRSGREIGTLFGTSKAAVEAEAEAISEGEDIEAVIAAIAAARLLGE